MARMARLVWTSRERLVLLIAWLGWTFDIMDVALFNFAKVPMVTEILGGEAAYKAQGPQVESGLLIALMIGWSCGGLVFGLLADRWGRLRTMALTILIYSVFTALTSVCHSLPQLYGARFMTGLGVGGEWAAGVALVAESMSEDKRARAASWLQSAAAFGPWIAAAANFALVGHGWRPLFLVGALPALLTVIVRLKAVEPHRAAQSNTVESGSSVEQFTPFWKSALVGFVIGIAGIAMAQNVSFWLPNLVKQFSEGLPKDIVQSRQSTAALVLHVGTLAGVFVVPWFCTKIGRRPTMLACFILGPLSVVAVAVLAKSFTSLLVLEPLMSFFGIGLSAAFVLYFPELFPANRRATGAGFSYNGGRIVAALLSMLTAKLIIDQSNVAQSIAQTSLLLALGAIALAFSPETKGVPLRN